MLRMARRASLLEDQRPGHPEWERPVRFYGRHWAGASAARGAGGPGDRGGRGRLGAAGTLPPGARLDGNDWSVRRGETVTSFPSQESPGPGARQPAVLHARPQDLRAAAGPAGRPVTVYYEVAGHLRTYKEVGLGCHVQV